MKSLTKAEEDVMKHLRELQEANATTILKKLNPPKPIYHSVSTVIRILENKGFVSYRKEGKAYIYFPLSEKGTFSNSSINQLMNNYFQGSSFQSMVSFFVKKKK